MMVIATLAMLLVIGILASLMLTDGVRAGKYSNPNVATSVVRGTIYDRNGRALAMEIPQYNLYVRTDAGDYKSLSQVLSMHLDLTPDEILHVLEKAESSTVLLGSGLSAEEASAIESDSAKHGVGEFIETRKEYVRKYPGAFHASQLVDQTERVFESVLYPAPGYNENTTYGHDVYLTIDLDIQYLLDLAVQQVYELQDPDYAVAFIMDRKTNEVLACTTYPFYDISNTEGIPDSQRIPRALLSSMNMKLVSKVTEHGSQNLVADYRMDGEYTYDVPAVAELANANDGYSALLEMVPEETQKYIVFFASVNPKYYQVSSVLPFAIATIEEGLSSQGKL